LIAAMKLELGDTIHLRPGATPLAVNVRTSRRARPRKRSGCPEATASDAVQRNLVLDGGVARGKKMSERPMTDAVSNQILELRAELEQYPMDTPAGFAARDAAVEWLSSVDRKLERLARLQRTLPAAHPMSADWFANLPNASGLSAFSRGFSSAISSEMSVVVDCWLLLLLLFCRRRMGGIDSFCFPF